MLYYPVNSYSAQYVTRNSFALFRGSFLIACRQSGAIIGKNMTLMNSRAPVSQGVIARLNTHGTVHPLGPLVFSKLKYGYIGGKKNTIAPPFVCYEAQHSQ
jgi:hypothetical protein